VYITPTCNGRTADRLTDRTDASKAIRVYLSVSSQHFKRFTKKPIVFPCNMHFWRWEENGSAYADFEKTDVRKKYATVYIFIPCVLLWNAF